METIEFYLYNYETYILLGLTAFVFLLLIWNIGQSIKLKKLKKRYISFMKSGEHDIEKLLLNQINELDTIKNRMDVINKKNDLLEKQLIGVFQKIGIVKYNAFKEMGGNLSYTIALLNNYNNGFLINGIHSREGSYSYIKVIENGEASSQLSDEERDALNQAINYKSER